MTRRAAWLSIVVGTFGSLVLLVLFAAPTFSSPLVAAQRVAFAPGEWTSPSSRLVPVDDGVRVEGEATPGNAMVTREDITVSAAALRYLHYRADSLDADARLILLWRSEDGVERRLLPRLVNRGAIDLAESPAWRGDITMLALVVIPVDYLAAEVVPEQAFVLGSVELRSDNWLSALDVLVTDWLAPRPWSGASINTAGGEFGVRGASLTAFVACWIAWILLVVRVAGGRAALRCVWPAVLAVGVGVLALDLGRDLLDRTRAVRSASARLTAPDAVPLGADPALVADATHLRVALGAHERIVVHGDPPFQRDYTVYLLREFDVAQLLDLRGFATRATLNNAVLVIAGGDGSEFDEAASMLQIDGQARAAAPLWHGDRLRAYRLGSAGAAK